MKILFIPGNSQSHNTFCKQLDSPLFDDHDLFIFKLESIVNTFVDPSPETFFFKLKDELVKLHKEDQYDCIVGHSWGGHLIVESIAELQGLKGIMTFGSPFIDKPPRMEDAYLPNPALPLFFTKDLTSEQLFQLADASLYNKEWVSYLVDGMKQSSGILRELTPAAIATGNYNDEVEAASNLTIPLAILHGEYDTMVNAEYYQSLQLPTLWKQSVQTIPQAGHFPQLENAKDFNRALSKFLSDL